jgi:hypothetical protein
MTKKKHPKTRYEELTFKEFQALPDEDKEVVHAEHIEALKARGDYNENTKETFFGILDKAINPDK